MKALIIEIIALFISTFATAQLTPTGDVELRTYTIYFDCNSAIVNDEINIPQNATILSVDAYASIDGNANANQTLSEKRGHEISSLLDFKYTAHGETDKFGNKAANRCVVIAYSIPKTQSSIRETVDVEGFTCGNHIDPSVYFADTLDIETVDTTSIIPEPIVLETIEPSILSSIDTVSIAKISVDTFFLPTRQAVRFQMKHHGMSRNEAIKSIEARKSQWKELKPKSKTRKSNARKVKMKRTRGACRRGLIRFIPNIGC